MQSIRASLAVGLNCPVSIELMVWRDTPTSFASSPCESPLPPWQLSGGFSIPAYLPTSAPRSQSIGHIQRERAERAHSAQYPVTSMDLSRLAPYRPKPRSRYSPAGRPRAGSCPALSPDCKPARRRTETEKPTTPQCIPLLRASSTPSSRIIFSLRPFSSISSLSTAAPP